MEAMPEAPADRVAAVVAARTRLDRAISCRESALTFHSSLADGCRKLGSFEILDSACSSIMALLFSNASTSENSACCISPKISENSTERESIVSPGESGSASSTTSATGNSSVFPVGASEGSEV